MKIYCEHGALTADLKRRRAACQIELVYFPVDPDSRSGQISPTAIPSAIQWRDANVTWDELKAMDVTWDDMKGSKHHDAIGGIIGKEHRRDVLHVDSAYKTQCAAFITRDTDILAHRDNLQALTGIRFFHPDRDATALGVFIDQNQRAG